MNPAKYSEYHKRYERYLYYKSLIQRPCPLCGSNDLLFDWHNSSSLSYEQGTTVEITCQNCYTQFRKSYHKNEANSCKAFIGLWNSHTFKK